MKTLLNYVLFSPLVFILSYGCNKNIDDQSNWEVIPPVSDGEAGSISSDSGADLLLKKEASDVKSDRNYNIIEAGSLGTITLHRAEESIFSIGPEHEVKSPFFLFRFIINFMNIRKNEDDVHFVGISMLLEDKKIHAFQCDKSSVGSVYETDDAYVECYVPSAIRWHFKNNRESVVGPLEDCVSTSGNLFIHPALTEYWLEKYRILIAAGRNKNVEGISMSLIHYNESKSKLSQTKIHEWILFNKDSGCSGGILTTNAGSTPTDFLEVQI